MNATRNIIALITLMSINFNIYAGVINNFVDHTFNYQGELLDNGTPANGSYTFLIGINDGNPDGPFFRSDTIITLIEDGLFNLKNIDLNESTFDGFNYAITIKVKKTHEPDLAYENIVVNESFKAVPYAATLIDKGAGVGDVLTYIGGLGWQPRESFNGDYTDLINKPHTPWVVENDGIAYSAGTNTISINQADADFLIDTSMDGNNLLRVRRDNVTKLMVDNNGGTTIGSNAQPPAGGLRVEENTVMRGELSVDKTASFSADVLITGAVGIGTLIPDADFQVNGTTNGDLVQVKVDGTTAFAVYDNGGVAVGSDNMPDSDSLTVKRNTDIGGELIVNGKVGIGTSTPIHAALTVESNDAIVAEFESSQNIVVSFKEQGVLIGILHSSLANDDDFALSSGVGDLHLIAGALSQPAISIDKDNGETTMSGDIIQPESKNGIMKYMVFARCGFGFLPSSIYRQYNGTTNNGDIAIANGSNADDLCVITFPTDINTRFWQVSPVQNSKNVASHCSLGEQNNQLKCYRYNSITGNNEFGGIMVLVY